MWRQYKHHNPKLINPLMKKLLASLSSEWYNSSYGNDLVASASKNISNDHVMTIYFPNSKKSDVDKELFNTFDIMKNVFSHEPPITCKSVEEVIKKIKELEK
tara:strand:- start:161 stop:466 length:306 start_codon:yes stop_codon:yes gene_type:complete